MRWSCWPHVTLNPDPAQLPGGGTLQQLANGIGGWALILALVGLVDRCRRLGHRGALAELPPVLRRAPGGARVGAGRAADRRGADAHQLLLRRRDRAALSDPAESLGDGDGS